MADYETLQTDACARIAGAAGLPALEALRIEFLGKQGSVSALLKTLGGMAPDERQEKAPHIQALRQVAESRATVRVERDLFQPHVLQIGEIRSHDSTIVRMEPP